MRRLHHVPLAFLCIYRFSDERGEEGDEKEGREWRLPGHLYADDLVLRVQLKEALRVMVEWFVEVQGDGTEWRGGIAI